MSRGNHANPFVIVLARIGLVILLLTITTGCGMISQGQNAEGVRMFQAGMHQAAISKFQQAVATSPKNPDAYYNLANAYHRLGKVTNRQDDFDQAENYYNQALDYDGNHRDAYRGLSVLLAEQGRKEEAFRLLEGWASQNPSSVGPKVELARLSEESGDRDRAKEYLLEAITLDPNDARALAALGKIYEDLGNMPQAIKNYERSLVRDRLQPELAARVSGLKQAFSTTPLTSGNVQR